MKAICLATIGLLGVVLSHPSILAETSANKAQVELQGLSTATKGFPYILKVTLDGPGSIPSATLFDETLPIRVTFVAVDAGRTYALSSSKGMDIVITTQGGERRDSNNQGMWQRHVERGKQQSVLVDLASIRPELGRGTIFYDLEPGQYDVTVTLPGDPVPSNTIRVRVVAPDTAEQQFLANILKQGSFSLGKGVNWSRVLRNRVRLPADEWDPLSSATKEQTAFHKLLADLNASDKTLAPDDENKVKMAPLPKFLEPERECLLHEVTVAATGQRDEAEASRLMKQYPDLEWRLQDLQAGKKDFLRFKKLAANKGK